MNDSPLPPQDDLIESKVPPTSNQKPQHKGNDERVIKRSFIDLIIGFAKGVGKSIPYTALALLIVFPVLKPLLFVEFNKVDDLRTSNLAIQQVHEAWVRRMDEMEIAAKKIEAIEKDLKELKKNHASQMEIVSKFAQQKEVFDREMARRLLPDGDQARLELLDNIQKKNLKNLETLILDLKRRPIRSEFKDILDGIEKIDLARVPSLEDVTSQFNKIYEAAKQGNENPQAIEGFSNEFINQITRKIKITVAGKEQDTHLKEILSKVEQALKEGDYEKALLEADPLKHLTDVQEWIAKMKKLLEWKQALQTLQNYKGPYFE